MTMTWDWIKKDLHRTLSALPAESRDVILVSTFFNPKDKLHPASPSKYLLTEDTRNLLAECSRILRFGGLLFVYGLPHNLAFWGQYLSTLRDNRQQMLFKYWIALDLEDAPRCETLKPTHQGLLMFLKNKPNGVQSPFHLNTSTVRIPHAYCAACGLNVKDWGGKKHLMNPNGIAMSDVWRDLPKVPIHDHVIPNFVLERVKALTEQDRATYLHVVQDKPGISVDSSNKSVSRSEALQSSGEWDTLKTLEKDRVYEGDCISFLEKVSAIHPEGIFDLTFADPPYNLKKSYDKYADTLAEQNYIDWCNRWLDGMAKTLKPGGSLIVLNLPKWAIHHAAFLNQRLEFRHWIAWDALSDPRGKIMPAHYALLHYTKPGAAPNFNYSPVGTEEIENSVLPPDSPKYCLRASCIKRRKRLGDKEKVELSDVWFDVHRIKHKRDRDAHPCQLPEKLMERIVRLTTNKGDLVFDPFCGVGTTAIAASKLGRHFVVVDLDPNYVRIATEKLEVMKKSADLAVPRQSIKRLKAAASKREVELYLQQLAQRLGREPSEKDIQTDSEDILRKIDLIYPSRLSAIKRCRVILKTAASMEWKRKNHKDTKSTKAW
jgi:DNA modification methylase